MTEIAAPFSRRDVVTPHFTEPLPPLLADSGGNLTAVVKIVVRGSLHAQTMLWSWDYAQTVANQTPAQTGLTQQQFVDLANAFTNTVLTPFLLTISNQYVITDLLMTQISSFNTAAQPIQPANYPKVGARSGESLPQNVAYVVSKYTQFRGRRGRGRIFIPGALPVDEAGGTLTAAYITTLATVWRAAMLTLAAGALSWTAVVTPGRLLKTKLDPTQNEPGMRGDSITTLRIQSDLRTQRRRNIGRGI